MNKIKSLNLEQLREEHENRWVAMISETGEVVASAESLERLQAAIPDEDRRTLVLFRVLPAELTYAPAGYEV